MMNELETNFTNDHILISLFIQDDVDYTNSYRLIEKVNSSAVFNWRLQGRI